MPPSVNNPTPTRHNGPLIRSLRIRAGMKPKAFTERVKPCTTRHLNNIENERGEVSLELLHRIAGALGVDAASLLRDASDIDRIAS